MAYVDLTNAFPSTNIPTLWVKMYNAGFSGPLFDWLRMPYTKMRYAARPMKGEEHLTAEFKSLIGLLTGDSASQILWNVYFAAIEQLMTSHPNDIGLAERAVSHAEQADDVALMVTSAADLQTKLDFFFAWCRRNCTTQPREDPVDDIKVQRSALHVEAGQIPIRYRRITNTLRFVHYAMSLETHCLPNAAMRDYIGLAATGARCHIADLLDALANLPIPVVVTDLNAENAASADWIASEPTRCIAMPRVAARPSSPTPACTSYALRSPPTHPSPTQASVFPAENISTHRTRRTEAQSALSPRTTLWLLREGDAPMAYGS